VSSPRPTRRQFCRATLLGVGVLPLASCRSTPKETHPTTAPEAEAPAALRTFNAATFATLSAICERILPRDQDPGAIDLGVPTFIDHMAATPELAPVRETLLRALPVFDTDARKRHGGKAFHELTEAEQDEILGTWQHGREGRPHFFDVVVSLTLEGAFGDPRYGGNAGGRGFAMLGVRSDPPLSKMALMPGMHHGSAGD
jgi:gluconate 2-dehydrogenase gamma chain